MTEDFVVNLIRETMYTMLLISAPVLLVSLIVGLIISILQAATSIQEVTLTFVPKVIVIAIVLVLTLPWMMDVLVSFTINLFSQLPTLR
ncbi:MAG TPA: flagellar biosynthetic protein FliQ [Bacteroidetes bacterium]|jgi:flagellar biosynthetic protein FliQ|nr:flagellar biosynthetic protein FliQ [Bacteroidota bacterium]